MVLAFLGFDPGSRAEKLAGHRVLGKEKHRRCGARAVNCQFNSEVFTTVSRDQSLITASCALTELVHFVD